jgi:hypothetical protein
MDTVVICSGQNPSTELYLPLKNSGQRVHLIGGAKETRELDTIRAIEEGTLPAIVFLAQVIFFHPTEQRHESKMVMLARLPFLFPDSPDFQHSLELVRADRDDEDTADGHLFFQSLGHFRRSGGDDDAVERSEFRQPFVTVF